MILLEDIRNATGGQIFGEVIAEQFIGFCHDARRARPGELYVALKSYRGDGHRQMQKALANGATGVLCQEPPTEPVNSATVILVGDTSTALTQWAGYILRQYEPVVIGAIGLTGIDVTQAAIGAVLSQRYRVCAQGIEIPGQIGVALALGALIPDHEIVVLALQGSSDDDLSDLLATVHPRVAVITDLTPRFPDVSSRQRVRNAEALLKALPADGSAIVNADDADLRELAAQIQTNLVKFSHANGASIADLIASNVHFGIDQTTFSLSFGDNNRIMRQQLHLLGRGGLNTCLAAVSTALLFEVPMQDALTALKVVKVSGRRTKVQLRGKVDLLDETRSDSAEELLDSLEFLQEAHKIRRQRIVVIGNLMASQSAELEIGRQAVTSCDILITYGERAASIGRAAREAGLSVEQTHLLYRSRDVISVIEDIARPGDVVVIIAGHDMGTTHIIDELAINPSREAQDVGHHPAPLTASSWIEIDLDGLSHNLTQLLNRADGRAILAIVKGNAYGHGAAAIATTALRSGAKMVGVGSLSEALDLRNDGITDPVLVLGHTPSASFSIAVDHDLTLSLYDRDAARPMAQAARELGKIVRVHIKVDTGLGDFGLLPSDVAPLIRELIRLDGVEIEGIYTDFAAAGALLESANTQEQIRKFQIVVESIRATGLHIPYVHAANSAALLTLPPSFFSMIRPGIVLYGLHPSVDVSCPTGIRRILSWKTHIAQIKTLPPSWAVGYHSGYRTSSEMRVAVIPVGYADGFRSSGPRNWGEVLIGGQRARLLGRVSMNSATIDISSLQNVSVGDEVVLIGKQGGDEITTEDIARRLDITNYEVVSSLPSRVPRIY